MEEENIETGKDMTPVLLEDLGMKFATENSKRKRRYGLYLCQYCGKEFECMCKSIKSGNTKSCGCQAKTNRKTHGLVYHPIYQTWDGMRTRCYNEKNKDYINYGGRGIKVCDRWLDVKNFIDDMYPSFEEGLTLDRIDVDGNYEPDNCRWANLSTQARNTRDIRCTNKSGFRGVSWCVRDKVWIAKIRVDYTRIHLGSYQTALEGAKAYERYVRLNNLEHNFTPALTEDELESLVGVSDDDDFCKNEIEYLEGLRNEYC